MIRPPQPSRLSPEAIRLLFAVALTHRPGFLVNSEELSSWVHMPPPKDTEHHQERMNTLETLPATEEIAEGTPVGVCAYADDLQPVCLAPRDTRCVSPLLPICVRGFDVVFKPHASA